jgi:hypothetical protein
MASLGHPADRVTDEAHLESFTETGFVDEF